ncbi:unnamed protein product [Prorocentrum cordatum]|uniref:Uncharacterized protein n=1 Tax=Prorocentrum cordatum TaxID=2364126 RepID=A0ABN9TDM6_9DINO|nr:unnamed protein product [Polarella glacialis]
MHRHRARMHGFPLGRRRPEEEEEEEEEEEKEEEEEEGGREEGVSPKPLGETLPARAVWQAPACGHGHSPSGSPRRPSAASGGASGGASGASGGLRRPRAASGGPQDGSKRLPSPSHLPPLARRRA